MKKGILLLSTATIILGSCKKEHGKSEDKSVVVSTWNAYGSTYTAARVTASIKDANLVASDSNGQYRVGIQFYRKLPSASGKYKIINGTNGIMTPLHEDEIIVDATRMPNFQAYTSSGYDNVVADIVILEGKISVSIPKTWLLNSSNGYMDSTQLSAVLTETERK